jgi:hypothetical protein
MANMQIDILGNGPLAEYEENGSVVKIGGATGIEIDCAALQADAAVAADICRDAAGNLVTGVSDGVSYVASIAIPAQERSEQLKIDENGDPVEDDTGNQVYEVVVAPLNMNKVRLSLWPYLNPAPVSEREI